MNITKNYVICIVFVRKCFVNYSSYQVDFNFILAAIMIGTPQREGHKMVATATPFA